MHLTRAVAVLLLSPLACAGEPPAPTPTTPSATMVIASATPAPPAAPSAPALPAVDASAPAKSAEAPHAADHGDFFHVEFEQDGVVVPSQGHDVLLDAKPFVIVVHFRSPDSVNVSASSSPRWFDVARTGGAFDLGNSKSTEAPFAIGRGMAENNLTPDPQIFLSDQASHDWFYESDKSHRCTAVTKTADGIACRRRVERVASGDPFRLHPLASYRGKSLYLVFVGATDGTDAADWGDRVEREREYFRLTIR